MKKTLRKGISLLIVLAMMLAVMPVSFAQGSGTVTSNIHIRLVDEDGNSIPFEGDFKVSAQRPVVSGYLYEDISVPSDGNLEYNHYYVASVRYHILTPSGLEYKSIYGSGYGDRDIENIDYSNRELTFKCPAPTAGRSYDVTVIFVKKSEENANKVNITFEAGENGSLYDKTNSTYAKKVVRTVEKGQKWSDINIPTAIGYDNYRPDGWDKSFPSNDAEIYDDAKYVAKFSKNGGCVSDTITVKVNDDGELKSVIGADVYFTGNVIGSQPQFLISGSSRTNADGTASYKHTDRARVAYKIVLPNDYKYEKLNSSSFRVRISTELLSDEKDASVSNLSFNSVDNEITFDLDNWVQPGGYFKANIVLDIDKEEPQEETKILTVKKIWTKAAIKNMPKSINIIVTDKDNKEISKQMQVTANSSQNNSSSIVYNEVKFELPAGTYKVTESVADDFKVSYSGGVDDTNTVVIADEPVEFTITNDKKDNNNPQEDEANIFMAGDDTYTLYIDGQKEFEGYVDTNYAEGKYERYQKNYKEIKKGYVEGLDNETFFAAKGEDLFKNVAGFKMIAKLDGGSLKGTDSSWYYYVGDEPQQDKNGNNWYDEAYKATGWNKVSDFGKQGSWIEDKAWSDLVGENSNKWIWSSNFKDDKNTDELEIDQVVYLRSMPADGSNNQEKKFTVTFVDFDGKVIKIEEVLKGKDATAPADPTRPDYKFTGWDKDFTNVQGNLKVKAQYEKNDNGGGNDNGGNDNGGGSDNGGSNGGGSNSGGGSNGGGGSTPSSRPTPVPSPEPDEEVIDEEETPLGKLNYVDHFAYIQGYPDGSVRPEGLLTREEVATIFFRLLDKNYREEVRSYNNDFKDVKSVRWSNKHISTLANGKILDGYSDRTFRPRAHITRAELATIASRFDKLEKNAQHNFTDIDGHWAEKYIASAVEKGWIDRKTDGAFKPDEYITRAEFVDFVNNVLDRHVNTQDILPETIEFTDLKNKSAWYYCPMKVATNSYKYETLEAGGLKVEVEEGKDGEVAIEEENTPQGSLSNKTFQKWTELYYPNQDDDPTNDIEM